MPATPSDLDSVRDLRWSTDRNSSLDPLKQWLDVVSGGIEELDVTTPMGREFTMQWQRIGLGPLDLHFMLGAPQRVVRSSAMVARSQFAGYKLLFMRQGLANLRHGDRQQQVAEGSFVLLNNQSPYDLQFPGHSDVLSGHFTEKWLRRWVPHPEQLVGRSIPGVGSWGGPLAALLVAIADEGLTEPDVTNSNLTSPPLLTPAVANGASNGSVATAGLQRTALADQFGALLALMAGARGAFAGSHDDELLTRLKRAVQSRFQEPDLTPARVAASAGISKRYLHALFAAAGTTFGATLMDIRLENARILLTNPRHRRYTIGDIAYECGFLDASHFARRFRVKFGMAPASYRERD